MRRDQRRQREAGLGASDATRAPTCRSFSSVGAESVVNNAIRKWAPRWPVISDFECTDGGPETSGINSLCRTRLDGSVRNFLRETDSCGHGTRNDLSLLTALACSTIVRRLLIRAPLRISLLGNVCLKLRELRYPEDINFLRVSRSGFD